MHDNNNNSKRPPFIGFLYGYFIISVFITAVFIFIWLYLLVTSHGKFSLGAAYGFVSITAGTFLSIINSFFASLIAILSGRKFPLYMLIAHALFFVGLMVYISLLETTS